MTAGHRFGCLVGNGLSIAYNPALSMRELTAGLVAEFSALGGGDAEMALSGFAKRFRGYQDADFESLIGPLEGVSGALGHLQKLSALADEAPDALEAALTTASHFVQRLYRVGFGTTLGLIASRAKGAGAGRFDEVVVDTCKAIAALNPGASTVVGTLNYDGLLHAGFLEAVGTSRMTDLAAGYAPISHRPDGKTTCTGRPIRTEDNLGFPDIALLNLHGSLSWLANPKTEEAWKFELEDLRAMDYWGALKNGKAVLVPVVVLTNRKTETIQSLPFSLAYGVYEDRMSKANRWLIAGYRFGDEPVNKALRRAASQRVSRGEDQPSVLVLTSPQSGHGFRSKVAHELGVSVGQIAVETSGLPGAITSASWHSWSS
jgi:hypothetical protein